MRDVSRCIPAAVAAVLVAACGGGEGSAGGAGNTAPRIAGEPPAMLEVGQVYEFRPEASDADGDALTFAVERRPAWLEFDAAAGLLIGAPGDGDVGTYTGIVLAVSDGATEAALPAFSVTVEAAGSAGLSITGAPPREALAGEAYVFEPNAWDADGDPVDFKVENLPEWASFDAQTGRISGIPGTGDVGRHDGIVIVATDGATERALPAFAVEVHAMASGTATLNWVPPTQYEDGTSLVGALAGYKIYWGRGASGRYTRSVTLSNPGLTSYVVENLLPGRYHFALTAFTHTGLESDRSHAAIKVVR